jgi:sulfonate transport system substrate-binding protein
VLAVYEKARKYSLANYNEERAAFQAATKLPNEVADIQLKQRTDLNFSKIGPEQRDSILQAGIALQKSGLIKPDVDVKKALDDLVADNYVPATN